MVEVLIRLIPSAMENQILPLLQQIRDEQLHFRSRFEEVDNRFDSINGKFDLLENKIDTMGSQINFLTNKVNKISDDLIDLRSRYSIHEEFMGTIMHLTGKDSSRMEDFNRRLEVLEERSLRK